MNYRKLTGGTLLFCSFVLLTLIPGALVSSPSSGQQQQTASAAIGGTKTISLAAQDALTSLRGAAKGEVTARAAQETGHYSFVSAQGGPLAADDAAARPEKRAQGFLAKHGGLLGMNEAERSAVNQGGAPPAGSDLQVARTETDSVGMTHVKMNQFYQGLPVFGAQVVVHMNGEGITAVNGKFVPGVSLSTIPALNQGRAIETALAVARKQGAANAQPGKVDLSIYALGLLEGFPIRNVLAYGVEVTSPELHEQIWIDAQNGAVLNRIPLRHHALNRIVYTPQYDPKNPNSFVVHKEGDAVPPPNVLTPTSNLYHYAGNVYNFFSSAFGRDSYDGKGIPMRSVYLVNDQCPNAYWNGQATNYCPEIDGDDVVAHEWGHAYTQFTHDLIYSYQSGALNESYSDVWGEVVDIHNGFDAEGGANNAQPRPAGQRWQIGEDSQGINQPALGILRNMYDPTEYGNPDKVSSSIYHCDSSDGGGVHVNSGVPNQAFALLVDGTKFKKEDKTIGQAAGTFNGKTVTGIGFVKAVHIYFRASTMYQTRTSNFTDHENALKRSCTDLTGQALNGFNAGGVPVPGETITADDCAQLAAATAAVEMSQQVPCKFAKLLSPDPAPICDGPSDIFTEDWESGEDGWTKTSKGVFEDWEDASKANTRLFKVRADLPAGRSGSAVFARNAPIGEEGGGTCTPGGEYSGQHTIESPEITIPAGADGTHLSFDHYVATELTFDGGQVEISRDGGKTYELVPQDQYVFNAPNAQFADPPPVGNNTNPNAGEFAWNGTNTGEQGGSWGTTVMNLAEMVSPGDKVKIRFTWSQDGCNGVDGWYVDNIRLYNCPVLEAPVISIGSDYEKPDTNGSYTLNWTRPAGASGPDTLQESTTSCGPLVFDNAQAGLTQWTVSMTPGYSGFNWQSSTEKPMHNSTTFRARAAENAKDASAILTYKTAIAMPSAGSTKLTFRDWNVNEGDDAVFVEVSEDGGTNWAPVYTNQRSDLAPFAGEFFATEPLFSREVDMTAFQGKTVNLRFRYAVGPDNRAGSSPLGWYIDDIRLQNENWRDIASTAGTSATVSGRSTGSYCYRVRSTYTFGSVTAQSPVSNVVNADVAPGVLPPARLQNIAARARVQTGDNVLFGGFILRDAPKRVIVRAIGPSLQSGGVPVQGRMSDPTLEVYQGGNPTPIAANDDWQANEADVQATNLAPTDSRESAIVMTLNPGSYTTILQGKNGEQGIGLVEIYDLDTGAGSTLRNLSARAFVEPGDNALIGGFIAGPSGAGATRVVVRAIGPSLQSQLSNALSDTTLEIVDANGTSTANDDWQQSPNAAEIQQAGLAPSDSRESAMLMPSLTAGPHTAIVRGKDQQPSGVGVVEIYNLQ